MYKGKTYERCQPFVDSELDHVEYINGVKVEPILDLLDQIDWKFLNTHSIPAKFHGDFQPENIICTLSDFFLIDWNFSAPREPK